MFEKGQGSKQHPLCMVRNYHFYFTFDDILFCFFFFTFLIAIKLYKVQLSQDKRNSSGKNEQKSALPHSCKHYKDI